MKFPIHEIPEKKNSWLIKEIDKNCFLKSAFYKKMKNMIFREEYFSGSLGLFNISTDRKIVNS
jgi:hypothetical protein